MIERYAVTHWANVPTMVVDLLAHPDTAGRDLSSLQNIFGGGASMPEAVAQKLFELTGVQYMEAYGMTETISQTHMNPPGNLRKQCLGIPTFDTESIVVDPDTLDAGRAGRDRRDPVQRTAALQGLLEQPAPPPRPPSSRSTAAGSCARATSAAWMRTASSISPTASSA